MSLRPLVRSTRAVAKVRKKLFGRCLEGKEFLGRFAGEKLEPKELSKMNANDLIIKKDLEEDIRSNPRIPIANSINHKYYLHYNVERNLFFVCAGKSVVVHWYRAWSDWVVFKKFEIFLQLNLPFLHRL